MNKTYLCCRGESSFRLTSLKNHQITNSTLYYKALQSITSRPILISSHSSLFYNKDQGFRRLSSLDQYCTSTFVHLPRCFCTCQITPYFCTTECLTNNQNQVQTDLDSHSSLAFTSTVDESKCLSLLDPRHKAKYE